MASELVKTETGAMAELYEAPDAAHIQLASVYLQQKQSVLVEAEITKAGDVVWVYGSDDPDPTFLISKARDLDHFTAYVVGRSSFVASTDGGSIEFLPNDHPYGPGTDAWKGYFFLLANPEIDPRYPARLMLWKTAGMPALKKLNTFIMRALSGDADGNPLPIPRVKFTVTEKTGIQSKQKYFALSVSLISADEHLTRATEMASFGKLLRAENDAPVVSTDDPSLPDL